MWIYTPEGFFSVVRKEGDASLTVRSWARADLDSLRKRIPELSPVEERSKGYRYRATVAPAAFARALFEMGNEIDYADFEERVGQRQGRRRQKSYGALWEVTRVALVREDDESPPVAAASFDYHEALDVAERAAREAGEILRAEFHREGGPRGSGEKCETDAKAEARIRAVLSAAFPSWPVVGEELGRLDASDGGDGSGHVWLVDPNDGTKAYLRGHRGSSVSIGLVRGGAPVLGVVYAYSPPVGEEDLFTWAEGCGPVLRNGAACNRSWPKALTAAHTVLVSQNADERPEQNVEIVAPARFRSVASIAYRLALVAAGEADLAVSIAGPNALDVAAGHALLRGAGGILAAGDGTAISYRSDGTAESLTGTVLGSSAAIVAAAAKRPWGAVLGGEKVPPLVRADRSKIVADGALLDRAHGCLLGQLAGDSLGSLVEFSRARDIEAKFPDGLHDLLDGGHWNLLAGQPTDDSELALALARALVERGEYDEETVAQAYSRWMGSKPFDIGSTTAKALGAALAARSSKAAAAKAAGDTESEANGALMRVSPLAVWGVDLPPSTLAKWARVDASLTHPSRVCQDSNAVFVVAVQACLRGAVSPEAVHEEAVRWAREAAVAGAVLQHLEAARDGLPSEIDSRQRGWVLKALQIAFHQLLTAPSPAVAIRRTAALGGDTDTNAAIAGALVGAMHGATAFPTRWIDRVLTCRPMAGTGAAHVRPREYWPVDLLQLAERLTYLGRVAASEPAL